LTGFKFNGGLGGLRARPESQCCARRPGRTKPEVARKLYPAIRRVFERAGIEQAMGHQVGGAVERAYRRTDILEKRL
jgi:hypothetical protein